MQRSGSILTSFQETSKAGSRFHSCRCVPSIKLREVFNGIRSVLEKQYEVVDKIFDNIIYEHRACKATRKTGEDEEDDLVHVLLNLMDQGDLEVPLTTDNIKAVIW
ncbi:hypothetical protein Ddye_027994 [Dipteronia dyeriana]|uniref:Cytochrome P450 n=1 Tax=Dipteronia dyeriana TaxID=168575 RepID=A0AAD9WQP4_9ROSI|nr:hypothetical protein Ddye_027994 [Dipteronia dyeriana]